MTPSPVAPALGPAPHRFRFSTEAVGPASRVAYWKEAICKAFVRLDLDCDPHRPFHATLAARALSRFDCIAVSGSAQRVSRSRRLVDEDRNQSLILMHQRQGDCLATQDGKELHLQAGGLALVDSRRPYSLWFPDEFSQTVIRVPACLLEQRLGRAAFREGRLLPRGSALGRLAGQALDALEREDRESMALPLSSIAFDLLALALAEDPAVSTMPPRMATMRVAWAKAQVMDSLRDPALSPQAVAERQGVSPRLLQRLFAAEGGSSLAAFILEQRLQRCRDALRHPAQTHRSITDIALSWGFNDPAHFTRVFRRRFGLAPRDWRVAPSGSRGDGH